MDEPCLDLCLDLLVGDDYPRLAVAVAADRIAVVVAASFVVLVGFLVVDGIGQVTVVVFVVLAGVRIRFDTQQCRI